METSWLFLIICMTLIFGNQIIAEEVKKCRFPFLEFWQVEGTNLTGYHDVIARGNQFVTLNARSNEIEILESFKSVHQKSIATSVRSLNLDLFNNIIFADVNSLGTYIPENDELFMKNTTNLYDKIGEGEIIFDEDNTLFLISNHNGEHQIWTAYGSEQNLKPLKYLDSFGNVTHLIRGQKNDFYFVHHRRNISWIVHGNTRKTMLQTLRIKSWNFFENNFKDGFLYFMDQTCTLKSFQVSPSFDVFDPAVKNIMYFRKCNNFAGSRGLFSYKRLADDILAFNENKIFYIQSSKTDETPCQAAELDNLTIINAAINSEYIMLATTNGLWAAKWR